MAAACGAGEPAAVIELRSGTRIWIAAGFTDLRRGLQGLSTLEGRSRGDHAAPELGKETAHGSDPRPGVDAYLRSPDRKRFPPARSPSNFL